MKTFIKFNIVGMTNTAVDLLLYFLLLQLAFTPGWAQAIGYAGGIVNSFFWNKGWTFDREHIQFGSRAFWIFFISNLFVLLVSTVWVMGVTGAGTSPFWAKLSSFGLTLPLSFLASKWSLHYTRT